MIKHVRWTALIVGILLVLASLFVINNPLSTLAGMGWFFAVIMLANGFSDVFAYFGLPSENRSIWFLVNGLATALLGLWLLMAGPLDWAFIIPVIFGFWVMISGITHLVDSFLVARTGLLSSTWSFLLIVYAILGAIFGLIIWLNPGLAATMTIFLLAGTLLYQGIRNILLFFRLG